MYISTEIFLQSTLLNSSLSVVTTLANQTKRDFQTFKLSMENSLSTVRLYSFCYTSASTFQLLRDPFTKLDRALEAMLKSIIVHSKYFPNSDWLKAHA